MFTQNLKFLTCSPLFIPVHFIFRMLINFWMKNWGVKREKIIVFCKLTIKDGSVFYTDIYIYNYNNKIIYMFIYNKSLKKCLRLFNKTFSNYQAAYLMEFYLLFEKSGNFFHTVSIEIGLTPPLPLLFVFIRSLRTPLPPPQQQTLCWKRWKELMIILVHSCI